MGKKFIISRRFLPNHIEYPPLPIIEHADLKRMLLFKRAVVEGALSLLWQCSYYFDMQKVAPVDQKDNYHLLLEILTPVAKSYPSDGNVRKARGRAWAA